MQNDTIGSLDAMVRQGLPLAKRRGYGWSLSVMVPRRAAWSTAIVGIAIIASLAWVVSAMQMSGMEVAWAIRQGCAVAFVVLSGLGAFAVVAGAARGREVLGDFNLPHGSFGDVTFTLDRTFRVRSVSPTFEGVFGFSAEAAPGCRALALVHPAERGPLMRMLVAMMDGQQRAGSLQRCRHADGRWIWIEVDLRLVRHPATARPEAILCVARDVSRWKLAEQRLEAANRRLATLALEDSVTGLANRRCFDDALSREYRRGMRSASPMSLLMIDVDRFKSFNDQHGHQAGDACLRNIASIVNSHAQRPGDMAARYGGEEFVMLLPGTGPHGASCIAERIRAAIEGGACGGGDPITVSIGTASMPLDIGPDAPADLVRSADRALYEAKNAGRNRVCAAPPLPGPLSVFELHHARGNPDA